MASSKTSNAITAKEFEEWLNGAMTGDLAEARAYCERTMSPNYLRFQAGGGRTDYKTVVQKVTYFRTHCKKWVAPVDFIMQDGDKIAVRLTCELVLGDDEPKKGGIDVYGDEW